jgi:hypothetical protein
LLRGLGLNYDPLITSITTRANMITLSDVYAYMLSFKMRQENNNNNSTSVGLVPLTNDVGRGAIRGGGAFGRGSRGRGQGNDGRGGRSSQPPAKAQSSGGNIGVPC